MRGFFVKDGLIVSFGENLHSTNRESDLDAAAKRRRGEAQKIAPRRSESILTGGPLSIYIRKLHS